MHIQRHSQTQSNWMGSFTEKNYLQIWPQIFKWIIRFICWPFPIKSDFLNLTLFLQKKKTSTKYDVLTTKFHYVDDVLIVMCCINSPHPSVFYTWLNMYILPLLTGVRNKWNSQSFIQTVTFFLSLSLRRKSRWAQLIAALSIDSPPPCWPLLLL